MQYKLKMAGVHFEEVRRHLFPGDGKEAIAIALCGRSTYEDVATLLVHKVLLIPHTDCDRRADFIQWPTEPVVPLLTEAMNKGMAILKIHSHPGWYDQFSMIDDVSDTEFFESVYGWMDNDLPHGSAVMLPDGSMFGRAILPDLSFETLNKISVAGDQIVSWPKPQFEHVDDAGVRTAQLFGEGTYTALRHIKVGVIGCSGTGSPAIEQLYRYQVGTLVIVDPKVVEDRNLNRIINSRKQHADVRVFKVDLMKEVIEQTGLGTEVIPIAENLYDSPRALKELSSCDVVIGGMDTAEGRDLVSRLSSFYLVPCIDMGISIDSDGKGGINKIEGSVHYIQPGKSTLLSRGVYSMDEVVAESLLRRNPEEYRRLIDEGRRTGHKYIQDVQVDRPAVIGINMQIAAIAINELLNRIHPYKISSLAQTAKIAVDVTDNFMVPENESEFPVDNFALKQVGRGDVEPLLDCVELSADIPDEAGRH